MVSPWEKHWLIYLCKEQLVSDRAACSKGWHSSRQMSNQGFNLTAHQKCRAPLSLLERTHAQFPNMGSMFIDWFCTGVTVFAAQIWWLVACWQHLHNLGNSITEGKHPVITEISIVLAMWHPEQFSVERLGWTPFQSPLEGFLPSARPGHVTPQPVAPLTSREQRGVWPFPSALQNLPQIKSMPLKDFGINACSGRGLIEILSQAQA